MYGPSRRTSLDGLHVCARHSMPLSSSQACKVYPKAVRDDRRSLQHQRRLSRQGCRRASALEAENATPLLAKLETTIRAKLVTLSTKSTLAKASNYSLNDGAALAFYCEDGRAEIGNVLAENALRRAQKLSVRRLRQRGRAARRDVWHDQDVKAQRDQTAFLPGIRPEPHC